MSTPATKIRIGPDDHGQGMSLDDFAAAETEPGHLYELAGGIIEVSDIPSIAHAYVLIRLEDQLVPWIIAHPGIVAFRGGGAECALRLPGAKSERHPDRAYYLNSPPPGVPQPWDRYMPDLVVEVVSKGGEKRDYVDKRHEYLAAGVREYWIIDPAKTSVLVLERTGDVFREVEARETWASTLLPGFVLQVAKLFVD